MLLLIPSLIRYLLLEILRISLIETESGKESKENINISVRVIEKIFVELCLRHAGKRLGHDNHFFNDSRRNTVMSPLHSLPDSDSIRFRLLLSVRSLLARYFILSP